MPLRNIISRIEANIPKIRQSAAADLCLKLAKRYVFTTEICHLSVLIKGSFFEKITPRVVFFNKMNLLCKPKCFR